jgi:hypothetical protein
MDRSGKERSTSSDECVGDETEIKAHTSDKWNFLVTLSLVQIEICSDLRMSCNP